MASNTIWPEPDGRADTLVQHGLERLPSVRDELVLDFSAVRRVDPATLRGLAELAAKAQENSVSVALRGVSVEVYKALKLAALTPRFSFLT